MRDIYVCICPLMRDFIASSDFRHQLRWNHKPSTLNHQSFRYRFHYVLDNAFE